jgi:hypothetical protein
MQVSGVTAYRLVNADIVTEDTAHFPSFFGNSACRSHVLMHEVGHAIGFGHSGDRDSILYATVNSAACDPSLDGTDLAGLNFLYPTDSGGGVPPVVPTSPTPPAVLAVPQNLSVSAKGSQLTISFSPVANAAEYDIAVLGICEPCGSVSQTVIIADPVPAGQYAIAVRARSGSVASAYTAPVVVTVGGNSGGALVPPTNIQYQVSGDVVEFSWDAVPGVDGYGISVAGVCDPCGVVGTNQVVATGVPAGVYTLYFSSVRGTKTSAPSVPVFLIVK